MPMARPTIYSEELLIKAREYTLTLPSDEVVHSIEGLAGYVGISRETIYAWEKEKEEFSDIVREVREKQAKSLVNNGLNGKFSSPITKVMLTKHGYREATDADITSGGEKLQGVVILPSRNDSTLETTTKTGDSPQV